MKDLQNKKQGYHSSSRHIHNEHNWLQSKNNEDSLEDAA